jgi:hypothetical protein
MRSRTASTTSSAKFVRASCMSRWYAWRTVRFAVIGISFVLR